ncbi:MAG: hypothetical protein DI598_18910, partial [Pseudopedobacter saltans]
MTGSPSFRPTVTGPGDIKYVDINQDKAINYGSSRLGATGDLVNFGDSYPHYLYGFSFGFKWKGIDFSTMFQGVGKRNFLPSIPDLYPFTTIPNQPPYNVPNPTTTVMPVDYNLNYWTMDNPNARFPRLFSNGTQNTVPSSYWV